MISKHFWSAVYSSQNFHWVKSQISSTLEIPKKTKKSLEISYFWGFLEQRKYHIFKIWKCHYVTFAKFPRIRNFKFPGLSLVSKIHLSLILQSLKMRLLQTRKKFKNVTFTKYKDSKKIEFRKLKTRKSVIYEIFEFLKCQFSYFFCKIKSSFKIKLCK